MPQERAWFASFLGVVMCVIASVAVAQAPNVIADPRFDTLVADVKATMLADPEKAVTKARAAQSYASRTVDPRQRQLMQITAKWLLGEAYTRTRDNTKAGPLIAEALAEAARLVPGSKLHADALLSRASIRAADGDVAGAMTDFHRAHDLFRNLHEIRSQARTIIQIAFLYYDANDWDNALKYYSEALDLYRADPGLAVSIRNGRGITLVEMRRFAEAEKEFTEALAIARNMDSPLLTATVLNNLARVDLASGKLNAAERAIGDSTELTHRNGSTTLESRQLGLAAQLAYQRGDYPRAATLTEQIFRGVDVTKTTLADREAHKTAYETYRALHRDDLALAHLAAFKRLDDEATELARSNGAALMAARFDFANQELRIVNLKADDLQKSVAFERARARTQRIALLSGVGVTLLIIAMLAFGIVSLRRSRDKVRAANDDLAETNTALGKALAAKTEFLATTSHEIRTPLNGILGMTQVMLADAKLDAATRDRVGVVHGAGVTMRALVDDILDVAKMETGNLTIESVPFDLVRTLSDATRMWQDQAIAKGLSFTVDLDDCPGRIMGDPSRLRQIVFNLLSNALKFTPEGSVVLETHIEDGRFAIAVTDTGIGIPADKHEEIFESFRQADAGTTRQFGGTGLGLSICRSLSRAMEGDVTVESTPGVGSTFILDLPLVAAEPEAVAADEGAPALGMLIVDRNPITRAMFKALLEPRAGPISVAANLDEALASTATTPVARILVDDATARAGGDAFAALKALAEAAPASTIAVLWSAGDEADHRQLTDCGVAHILVRPIGKDALVAAICDEPNASDERIFVTQAA